MVLIDEENRVLHTFYTAPAPPSYDCHSGGGAIYEKATPLDAISFATGYGTPVILDADSPFVHDVSSTKQNVNSKTGIALLAVNTQTDRYWHQYRAAYAFGAAQPADRRLHRHPDLRHGTTRGAVQRPFERQSDELVLGLRRRQHLDRAAPDPHLRRGRQLHRQPDRHERGRLRHRVTAGLHQRRPAAFQFHAERLTEQQDDRAWRPDQLHDHDRQGEWLHRSGATRREWPSERSVGDIQPQPRRHRDRFHVGADRDDFVDGKAGEIHA